jgi:hypothetical protein
MAKRLDCHEAASTLTEVTASGGGTKDCPAWIMARICPTLIPTRATMTTTIPTNEMIQTLPLDFMMLILGCSRVAAV